VSEGGPTSPNDYVPPVQVSPAQAAPDVDVDDAADAPPMSELDRANAKQRERERVREAMNELDAVRRRRQDADDAGNLQSTTTQPTHTTQTQLPPHDEGPTGDQTTLVNPLVAAEPPLPPSSQPPLAGTHARPTTVHKPRPPAPPIPAEWGTRSAGVVHDPNAPPNSMREARDRTFIDAMSQPPMPAQSQMIASMRGLVVQPLSQVQDQLDEASPARGSKARARLQAERMLREAMGLEKNILNGIGEPPRPYMMVAREVLINLDVAATSWRLFDKDLKTLHCLRFYPPCAPFVTDDPGLCCDMLVKLNTRNTHTLA
jgi:hypothetical protein